MYADMTGSHPSLTVTGPQVDTRLRVLDDVGQAVVFLLRGLGLVLALWDFIWYELTGGEVGNVRAGLDQCNEAAR